MAEQRYKKLRPFLKCMGISLAIAFLSMAYFLYRDGGAYVIQGDLLDQTTPIQASINQAIKNGSFPGWGWNIALGTQMLGCYATYNLGSPFFWLTLPFSKLSYPFLVGWLCILKYAVAAAGAYWYMTLFLDDERLSTAGALLYAFSSAHNQHLMYQFSDSIALFPFMLVGLEYILRGKKPWLFILAVFFNCSTNYYLFIGEVVFCVVYTLCRMWEKSCRATFIKALSTSVFGGVVGVGMAAAIFIPSILFIMQNSRIGGGLPELYYTGIDWLKMLRSIMLPAEHMGRQAAITPDGYGGYACYLPMIGVAYLIPYLIKKRDWLFVTIIVFSVFAASPLLESSFSMFSVVYKRWLYMFTLPLSLASMRVAREREEYPVRLGLWITSGMLIWVCVRIVHWDYIIRRDVFLTHVIIAGTGILLTVMLQYAKSAYRMLLLTGIALFSFLTALAIQCVTHGDAAYTAEYMDAFQFSARIPAGDDAYRYDLSDNFGPYLGDGIGIGTFNSTISPSIAAFQSLFDHTSSVFTIDYDAVPGLKELVGARYHITEWDQQGNPVIEEQPACPIGYAYDRYITEEELKALPLEKRGIAALNSLIIKRDAVAFVSGVLDHSSPDEYISTATISSLVERNYESRVQDFKRDAKGFYCKTDYSEDCMTFFSVPFDQGWSATIDKSPTGIIYAGGMMAIRIPAGQHEITFSYAIPGLRIGMMLTVIAWIVFILCIILDRKHSLVERLS